eukprot:FR736044.1.p1 GENE.FR736044.1~~FR736044.1.p1  ORF type:complete len:284 (+),score=27.73 FR736044.1:72-854(+)
MTLELFGVVEMGIDREFRNVQTSYYHFAATEEEYHELFCFILEYIDHQFDVEKGTYLTYPLIEKKAKETLLKALRTSPNMKTLGKTLHFDRARKLSLSAREKERISSRVLQNPKEKSLAESERLRLVERAISSKRVKSEALGEIDDEWEKFETELSEAESNGCQGYRVDVTGASFGDCVCGLPREAHRAKKVSSMRAKSFAVGLPKTPEKPQVCIKVARTETPDPRPGEMYFLDPPLKEHVMVPVAPLPPVGPESPKRTS